MNLNKLTKRVFSMLLALVLVFTAVMPMTASAATSHEDFIRVFHLDVGRKYFTVAQVTEIIDALSESGYTHMELAIGNEATPRSLRNMTASSFGNSESSSSIRAEITMASALWCSAT